MNLLNQDKSCLGILSAPDCTVHFSDLSGVLPKCASGDHSISYVFSRKESLWGHLSSVPWWLCIEYLKCKKTCWLTYFFCLYLSRAQKRPLPFLWEGPAWNNPWPGYKHKVQQWAHAPSWGLGESSSTGLPRRNRIYLLCRHHKFFDWTPKDRWKQPGNYSQRW